MTAVAGPSAAHAPGAALAEDFAALASGTNGLSNAEAARRLARFGANEPRPPARHAGLAALMALFANPLVLMLLAASVVSAALGDVAGAAIIVAIVLLGLALNAILSRRSQRAAARLRDEVAPVATVCRDGAWRECARRELVPGDVIRLSAGDHVPADARLIEARDLHLQQAALTGESAPAEKEPADATMPGTRSPDARHLVFLGTSVVAGTATALVYATGRATAFGDVAEMLGERPPRTEFERGLDAFTRLILRVVVVLVVLVFAIGASAARSPIQSLLFALALAVGLTPEFMPMIVAVTLARGAVRMARRHVIVKHLSAIEDFGSMTVLLSDKTGTLTSGEANLVATVDAAGAACERPFELAFVNSALETGIRSPLDAAILRRRTRPLADWRKLDEIPFDFERRRLCVVAERGGERLLIVKGAPESVLAACTHAETAGGTTELTPALRDAALRSCETAATDGLRAIAVAWRSVPEQARYAIDDESHLTLAGFLLFADTVVADAAESLRALARDGVVTKILTGDHEAVARHVCVQVGIDCGRVVNGPEIDALDDAALAALTAEANVFARVTPAQKHRIVLALKSRDEVVGFLGDGINDAPSLHAADVGISVAGAVDVARDAADIVLRERSLRSLHEGVIEGRRAFANVMKYLMMGTSSNFGNMVSMAAGTLFLPFLPMLPMQVLLNNFLYDIAQVAIPADNVERSALRRPVRWNIGAIRRFMLAVGPVSSLFDFLTFYVLLRVLDASETLFHTGWFVESLATQTLVLFVIRTGGNPLRSRPSAALVATVAGALALGLVLPLTPFAARLGFVPLPREFLAFVAAATAVYLLLVEWIKRRALGHGGTSVRAQPPVRARPAGIDDA